MSIKQPQPSTAREDARMPTRARRIWSHTQSFAIAILLALVFRQFVVQAFRIPSESMRDTLLVGDFLFVNKFLYGAKMPFSAARLPRIRPPARGDIIVFVSPVDGRDFIKRCVAVPGDTVEVRNKVLYVNRKAQDESYVRHEDRNVMLAGTTNRDFMAPYVVPPEHLFMMGDNRDNSHDSRFWGALPTRLVKGKAIFIYFSVDTQRGFFPPHIRLRRFGRIIR
jgi:signal peptidase I